MKIIIVTSHEVIEKLIMMILGIDYRVEVKSHVNPQDIADKVVFSDHRIPPYLLNKTKEFFVLHTSKRVDLSCCSIADLIVNKASFKSLKSGKELKPQTIKKAYYSEIGVKTPSGGDIFNEVQKARESLKLLNY